MIRTAPAFGLKGLREQTGAVSTPQRYLLVSGRLKIARIPTPVTSLRSSRSPFVGAASVWPRVRRHPGALTALLIAVVIPCALSAQENSCVTCHFENVSPGKAAEQAHLDDWDASPHAASQVGCDACHRGDPDAGTLADVHRDILSPNNPASSVYVRNIPETCGGCHLGQLDAFVTSRHDQLLASGDLRAPTCTTCHGAVGARLPPTRGISNKCAMCHGPDGAAPISDHQELVRLMRDRIQEHRYSLALVRTVIENTSNPNRRADLIRKYDGAVAPLDDAVAAWHAFAFDQATNPLERAGALIRELVDELTPD